MHLILCGQTKISYLLLWNNKEMHYDTPGTHVGKMLKSFLLPASKTSVRYDMQARPPGTLVISCLRCCKRIGASSDMHLKKFGRTEKLLNWQLPRAQMHYNMRQSH